MSKSLKRVKRAIEELGLDAEVIEMPGEPRTAQQAADAAGCELDQIAKSIVFQGKDSGQIYLFITAGGNQVDTSKAQDCAGETLTRADANAVRGWTGFAIGGVSPIGHLNHSLMFFDPRLLEFDEIWGAAGTPRHIFRVNSALLLKNIDAQLFDFTEFSKEM